MSTKKMQIESIYSEYKDHIPTLDRSSHRLQQTYHNRNKNFQFKKLNEKYIITHQISKGGYGTVFVAFDNPSYHWDLATLKPEKLKAFYKEIKSERNKI